MENTEWVIVDTETTGFASPIFVVELAAQRMRGWKPVGNAFRRLLNHGAEIPPEASRVHGYTREILERDGDPPCAVHEAFARYAGGLPIASYNLAYDWDDVLVPEWQRLGVGASGSRGLCLLKLVQRLLDPSPAGNCKLQTLRQYYRMPERGAHTALGDVETSIDLVQRVLAPLTAARGLATWQELVAFSESEWFPARIRFGKFKGRLFRDGRRDPALRAWLEWLASSANPRSARMGSWYLAQLDLADDPAEAFADVGGTASTGVSTVVIYTNPDVARLQALIDSARNRLVDLETSYARDRHAVAGTQARLFALLRPIFQQRDLLKLRVDYRRRYLDTLFESGEEEAAEVDDAYERARDEANADYEQAAAESAERKPLTADEEVELKSLWRRLVRLFHPDRITDGEEKKATYQRLTAEINRARDAGDLDRLREIAADPQGFIARQGWRNVELEDSDELDKLKQLYETLEAQILELLEQLDTLRTSPEYELHQRVTGRPELLDEVARKQCDAMDAEIKQLEENLARIEQEIEALQT